MRTPIRLPDLGMEPVTLSVWFADLGEKVFEGERVVEVLLGGATFDVASPETGRLVAKHVRNREVLLPGQVLGEIDTEVNHES